MTDTQTLKSRKKPLSQEPHKRLALFKDKFIGRTAFIIGNGVSSTFYDTKKLAEKGMLFGCNAGFTKHPLDFLLWADSSMNDQCYTFEGMKLTTLRRNRKFHLMKDSTYYIVNEVKKGNAGYMSIQAAIYMGFDPVILVGCDCRVFVDNKNRIKTNVFRDKAASYINRKQMKATPKKKGRLTTNLFETFAKHFHNIYKKYKDSKHIYQLGDHGILNIPVIEFSEFWTDEHPGRKGNRKSAK